MHNHTNYIRSLQQFINTVIPVPTHKVNRTSYRLAKSIFNSVLSSNPNSNLSQVYDKCRMIVLDKSKRAIENCHKTVNDSLIFKTELDDKMDRIIK